MLLSVTPASPIMSNTLLRSLLPLATAAIAISFAPTFVVHAEVVVDLNSPDEPSIEVAAGDSWVPTTAPLARTSYLGSGAPGITDLDDSGEEDDFLDYNRFSVTEALTPQSDYRGQSFYGGLTRRQFDVKNRSVEPEDSGQVVSGRNGSPAYVSLSSISGQNLGNSKRPGEYGVVFFVDKANFLEGGDALPVPRTRPTMRSSPPSWVPLSSGAATGARRVGSFASMISGSCPP